MNDAKEKAKKERDVFDRVVGKRMRNARKAHALTQEAMADTCGYSVQMIRRFESAERSAPIPAFVLYQYAMLCGRVMDELCFNYLHDKEGINDFFSLREEREKEWLKVFTEDEKALIASLRRRSIELDVPIATFLTEMNMQDYLLLHCLLELRKQCPQISKSIRRFIRSLYLDLIKNDNSYLRDVIVDDEELDL